MTRMQIAAVFDVDGTLIANTSLERIFFHYLWQYGELRLREVAHLAAKAACALAADHTWLRADRAYLKGREVVRLKRLARDCFEQRIAPRLLPMALERLRWHRQAGHCVILLSGTLDLLLEPLAEHLGVCARLGTEIELAGRQLTGRIKGIHPYGPAKADSLMALSIAASFDLTRSFAYADSYADRYLLAMVGYPVAANPDRRLRRLAKRREWMIEDFIATNSEE